MIVFFGEAFMKLKMRSFDSEFISLHSDIRSKLAKEIQTKRERFEDEEYQGGNNLIDLFLKQENNAQLP